MSFPIEIISQPTPFPRRPPPGLENHNAKGIPPDPSNCKAMIVQATIPDYLMRQAAEVAERENTTVDSIISIALSSQVTAWQVRDTVEQRAKRGASSNLGPSSPMSPISRQFQVTRNRQPPGGGCKIRQSWRTVLPAGSIARGKKAGQRHGSPLPQAHNWALDRRLITD